MTPTPAVRSRAPEVVGVLPDRSSFEAAVNALTEAGFDRADLSVLASHESLDAAGRPAGPWRDAITGLVGDLKYEGPLVASGAILLAGGPTAAAVAAVIGAAVGGVAAAEALTGAIARPHTDDFARSVEAGSVILWVRAPDTERQGVATDLLARHGAANVHLHGPADA